MKAPLLFVGGTLATPRLALEPLTPAHAPLMFEGFADPALYRWINAEPPVSVDDLRLRFERIANPYARGRRALAQLGGATQRATTCTRAWSRRRSAPIASSSSPTTCSRRSRARASRARRAPPSIEHLWRSYDAAEVRADIDFRNVPSRCLVEALGFVRRTRNIVTTLRGAPSVDYRYRLKRPGPPIR